MATYGSGSMGITAFGSGAKPRGPPLGQHCSQPSSRPSSNPGSAQSGSPSPAAMAGTGLPSVPITIIRMAPQQSEGSVKLKLVRPSGPNGPIQVSQVPQVARTLAQVATSSTAPQTMSSRLPGTVHLVPQPVESSRRKDNPDRTACNQYQQNNKIDNFPS